MQRLGWFLNVMRLALFALGYGLTGALVSGTLNRIMVAEIGFPISLVGLIFAVPILESPVRVWLGYRSDGYPIAGLRREPYILAGSLVAGLGVLLAVLLTVNAVGGTWWIIAGIFLAFVVYGFGRNLSHNTFQALLSDKFPTKVRQRAVTLFEVVTLVGLVMGSGLIGRALEEYDPAQLVSVTLIAISTAFVLALLAAVKQEPRNATVQEAADKAKGLPFWTTIREIVVADRQVRIFFALVVCAFVGTLAQDVLLEPYGALVLDMAVGETTRLTAYWGVGVLISMLLSGLLLLRWLGYMRVMRFGLAASALVFAGVIVVGMMGNAAMFKNLVFVMGLGTGLAGAGMLAGIVTFSSAIRAGLLMGVWGMANVAGRALGSVMGGVVVDGMLRVSGGNALLAYSTVFSIEVVMLVAALVLSFRLNPAASLAHAEESRAFAKPVGSTAQ